MKPLANIHRRSGWSVGVSRRDKRVKKYFGDAEFGGRAAALTQSTAYRDELLRRLPPPRR